MPGAVFVVGDPKQSIYRFRRADIELYGAVIGDAHRRRARADRELPFPPGDHRVGQRHARPPHAGRGQRPAGPLLAAARVPARRPRGPGAGRAPRWPGAEEGRADRATSASARPTSSRRSRAGCGTTGWRVQADGGRRRAPSRSTTASDEWVRPARFADVAVLLPTRTLLARARGRVRGRRRPAPHREPVAAVRDHRVPRPRRDPRRDRRPRRRDPARRRAAHARVRLLGRRPPRLPRGRRALVDLRRRARGRCPPTTRCVARPGRAALAARRATAGRPRPRPSSGSCGSGALLTLALAHRRPRDHWRRLRFLTDAAHAFTDAGGASLRGFVQWLDEQTEEGARVNESVRRRSPTTTRCGCSPCTAARASSSRSCSSPASASACRANPLALYHGDPNPEVRLTTPVAGYFTTAGYDDRSAREDLADRHEGMRLLYVATTRGTRPPRRQPPPPRGHEVPRRRDRTASTDEHELPWRVETVDPDAVPAPPPAIAAPGRPSRWRRRRAGRHRRGRARRLVERAARRDRAALDPADRRRDRDRQGAATAGPTTSSIDERRVVRGRARGRPAGLAARPGRHRARPRGRTRSCRRSISPPAPASRARPGRRRWPRASPIARSRSSALARSVLEAPTIRAAAAGRSWREVPVAAEIDGTTIEGFVDLLVEDRRRARGRRLQDRRRRGRTPRSTPPSPATSRRARRTRWPSSTCSAARSRAASSCSPGAGARPSSGRSTDLAARGRRGPAAPSTAAPTGDEPLSLF